MSLGQNKIARGAVWVIMGLVLVGLIGFGSFNFGGGGQTIGKVGETEISANRYFREVNAQLDAIQQQFGQRLPFAQAQAFGVDQQALRVVLSQVAMENETARLGLSVGDEELAKRIRDIPAFSGVDGSFDRTTYDFVLQQSGLTATEFEESLRSEVARTILQTAVAGGAAVQPAYVDRLYGWARETRDVTWAALDAGLLDAPVGAPDDAQLTEYYEANPQAFTLPETRKITYGWIRPEDIVDQVEVSEADLRAAYTARAAEFNQPERRLVERLVFPDPASAEAAAARLTDGSASFEDLVAERGLDLADIDLGDVSEDELGAAGAVVFALDGPGTTGVAESSLGPAIFRVNAVLSARETSFEEAEPDLRGELALEAARRQLETTMADVDDALAGGATIEDIGSEFGLTVETLDWTGTSFDGIAAYDEFAKAATEVTEDDYPEVERLADGGLFALRLDAIVPPTLQPLDDVRDEAVAGWTAAETVTRI
ncbi:MAG: SurA N-terminal domain-containing protein, partial [Maritimibacter sp.]|nr:SurA N-terminal domain-containing protein [Maritimibacter sp.]